MPLHPKSKVAGIHAACGPSLMGLCHCSHVQEWSGIAWGLTHNEVLPYGAVSYEHVKALESLTRQIRKVLCLAN